MKLSAPDVADAVLLAAQRESYDPVRRYLDRVRWDGVPRIDVWLSTYLGVEDTPLHRAFSAKWLQSAVARTYDPGCQADYCLTLEGPQGPGKSSALRALCADERWFSDQVGDLAKTDAKVGLAGLWVVELSELAAAKKAEVAHVKQFLTQREDRYRAPYGRTTESHPRMLVFAASTNEEMWNRDATGARRFWPVKVGKIDVAGITADRDQLWAEARVRHFAAPGTHWLDDAALEAEASAIQGERLLGDEWETQIAEWLAAHRPTAPDVTLSEVMLGMGIAPSDMDQPRQRRASAALAQLGWTATRIYRGAARVRGFARP